MKRIILSLALILAVAQVSMAQDIDKLMTELAKMEGVEHQVVDREMLDASLNAAMEADASVSSQMPSFMKRITSIEIVASEDVQPELKSRLLTELNNFKDGNGYETLMRVKEDGDNVCILAQRENGVVTAVIIFAIDEEDVAIVKMSGNFVKSDLDDIIKEQSKNN